MAFQRILKLLCDGPVIPAARTYDDFKYALFKTPSPSVILLFGDINTLSSLLALAQEAKKRLLVHLDLLEGVGKDKAGLVLLARMGVTAVITTKPHLARYAREEGLIVVQRMFLVDSESLRTGICMVNHCKPDALEVLPATIPAGAVSELIRETGLPVLAGGLVYTREDIENAVKNGICAVSTSKRALWNIRASSPDSNN